MKTSHVLFTKALALAKHGVDDRSLGIELGAADGRLTIIGRTVEREIRMVIPAAGDLPTKTYAYRAISALTKACKKDKSGEIAITDTTGGLRLKASGRTFDLPKTTKGLREPLKLKGTEVVEGFGAAAFVDGLRYVMPARSKDDTHEHLSWVHLDRGRMFATNGHVIHVANAIGGELDGQTSLRSANAIVDAVKATDADWVMTRLWTQSSKKARTQYAALELSIDGPLMLVLIREHSAQYAGPPIDQLKTGKDKFTVDAKALGESMSTAYKVLKAGNNHATKGADMLVNGDLRVATDQFSEVLTLAKKATREQALRVNPLYMVNAVKMAGNVTISYGERLEPLFLRAGDRVAIVMPMK